MNRESITRLVQCIVVPFVGMFAAGRLTGGILVRLGAAPWAAAFGSFLVSALLAAFLYRCLDPEGWANVFRESVGEPCSLPLAFCHVGYSLLWLMGTMWAVNVLFPAPAEEDTRLLAGAVLSAVLVHPILEEWLFRRVFLARLLDLAAGDSPATGDSPAAGDSSAAEIVPENGEPAVRKRTYTRAGMLFAVLTQAVLFALMHSGGGAMLYGFAGGVILGILMLRTGRLWVPVAAHMAVNLRSVVWPMLPGSLVSVLDWVLIGIGLLCGCCFWIAGLRQMCFAGKGENRS